MSHERIKLQDTSEDMLIKLSDGNPGGVTVLLDLMKKAGSIDPDCAFGPIGPLLSLDTHGIYGSHIWILFKDICEQNHTKMLAVLRAVQLGFLSEEKMKTAISCVEKGKPHELNVDDCFEKVKEKLPSFGQSEENNPIAAKLIATPTTVSDVINRIFP